VPGCDCGVVLGCDVCGAGAAVCATTHIAESSIQKIRITLIFMGVSILRVIFRVLP
jgi:hypothetical protein